MADLSSLDSKYSFVYNCPFCNRRNVAHPLSFGQHFNWTNAKSYFAYFVVCSSCEKTSVHLTFERVGSLPITNHRSSFQVENDKVVDLDSTFFSSVPTSFFPLNDHIPKALREIMTEAEGCLKSNFLTGASACARKLVYETAVLEKAEGTDYESRLKSLKTKRPDIDSEYFDTLLTIQEVTKNKVHEESYGGWGEKALRLILSTLYEILNALYVLPKTRIDRREAILKLKREILGDQKDLASIDPGEIAS